MVTTRGKKKNYEGEKGRVQKKNKAEKRCNNGKIKVLPNAAQRRGDLKRGLVGRKDHITHERVVVGREGDLGLAKKKKKKKVLPGQRVWSVMNTVWPNY